MELNGASIQSHAMLPNCARSLGGLAEYGCWTMFRGLTFLVDSSNFLMKEFIPLGRCV